MSILTKHRSPILSAAIAAVFASAAGAQTSPTFKISMCVRETNSTAAIGETTTPTNTGDLEYVNKDGLTATADGTWQKFTFNFGTDPVASFVGNGVFNGTRGVFEQLRFLNSSGTTTPITMLIDDVVNTVGGVDYTLNDFEAQANGAFVGFQTATNSSSAQVTAGSTAKVINTAAHTGSKSYEEKWTFVDGGTTRAIRFSTATSGGLLKPNPTIDYSPGNSLSFWLNISVPTTPIGWNTDSDGNWSDATKWAGTAVAPADNIPNTLSEVARFLPTTAARTVTVDQDFTVNGINLNSPNAYTIAGTNKIILNATVSLGLESSVFVQAGNHVISAPIEQRAPLTVTVNPGASLKVNGFKATDSAGADSYETLSLTKLGTGTLEVTNVRNNTLTVSAGSIKITPSGTADGTSEVNAISFAGGATPTSKLDITNNALIIDYDTTATTPRPTPFASIRARIVNGLATGDWSGNGITSSSAAAQPGRYAIGYAEASSLGITTFAGRTVDAEAVLVRYTFKGDANLSGNVNFDDLIRLAQNYNGVDKVWANGDFTYDGNVNFDDLIPLAQNYNQALSAVQAGELGSAFAADFALARALVPEPTTLGLLGGIATIALRRRRA